MKLFKLSSLTFAVMLSGCHLPEPKEARSGDGATFAITSFEGKATTRTLNQKTGLPVSNIYNYKACLSDLRQKKPMIGHKFEVVEIQQPLSTDVNGCLTWSETVEYNYLAASKYLKISRTLKGLGPQFGTQSLNFAIDPWSHGEANPKDAIDLSKNTLPADLILEDSAEVKISLQGKSLSQSKATPRLWLNMSRLLAVEDRITGKGFEINYDFQSTPQVKLTRMNGEQTFTDLTTGQLKGKMQLIHVTLENGKVQRKVLASKDFADLQIANKVIAFSAHLNFEAPYWGHLYLGIQLTPTQELSNLEPFEGVYYLGDYRSVNAGGFLLLSSSAQNNPSFTLDKFIAGQYPIDTSLETPPTSARNETSPRGNKEDFNGKNLMAVAALTFSGARVDQDSAHRRILKYQVQACLSHPITHDPIRGQPIEVTSFRVSETEPAKKQSPLISQMDGCITWPEEMVVEAYSCQKYVKGFVELKNSDLGIDRKINVFINPWLTTYEIGVDELKFRNALGQECDAKKELEKPSYIFINSFQYNLMDVHHDLDPNLNMVITRDFQMDLDLTLVNNSNLHGPRDGSERLRDGLYLVKSVLTENPLMTKTPRLISANSSIVQSRNGHITINPIPFKFLNPLDIGNRNRLLVQILPVDSEKATLSTDRATWAPKAGLKFEDVVDVKAHLLPMIYEAKIILMGEGTRANLMDTKRTLMEAVMAGKTEFQTEFTQVLSERQKMLETITAQGLLEQERTLKEASAKSSIADYAQKLSAVLINLDEPASKNINYLQRLLSFDTKTYFQKSMGFTSKDSKAQLADAIREARPISKDEVLKQLSGDKLSADVARRICVYYMTELLAPALSKAGQRFLPGVCADRLQATAEKMLVREKVYHVNKFDHFSYLNGRFENMTIANSFSMAYTFTDSHSNTKSASMGIKVPDLFFVGGGVQTSLAWTTQTAESASNTVNVTHTLPIRYQVSQTQFDLRDYETCYRIRMNPNLFIQKVGFFEHMDPTRTSFYNYLNLEKTPQEVYSILNRGLLVCERPKEMKPLRKYENFYVVQQEPVEGELQDRGNAKNRFLFLSLRGDQEFQRFEELAKSEVQLPAGARLGDVKAEDSNRRLMNSFSFKPWTPKIFVEPLTKN